MAVAKGKVICSSMFNHRPISQAILFEKKVLLEKKTFVQKKALLEKKAFVQKKACFWQKEIWIM